jgi:uncharacterized protein YndB with AHSA1/START domain
VTTPPIRWKLLLKSPPGRVYDALATNEGRRSFWALEADEREGAIHFRFPNGWIGESRILRAEPPGLLEIDYFGARTRFEIAADGAGSVLTLTAEGVPDHDWNDVHAGWVAVLLALKGRVDFGIDLRNGDPSRSWDEGFVDP